jgi:putative nucleotidyltransferase with HDIG domain
MLTDGLHRFLMRAGFNVVPFTDPMKALAEAAVRRPRVVVTDKEMPGMSGLDLAERVLDVDPRMKVILITGAGDEAAAQAALRLGAADYLMKPVELTELARTVQRALTSYAGDEYASSMGAWLRTEVTRQAGLNREIILGTLSSLVNALEARNPHFRGHSHGVAEWATRIAGALGSTEVETEYIHAAGLLHDIGMIGVPDSVVEKPGPLQPEELARVQDHCRLGAEILRPMTHLGSVITFVLEHHERIDGSGYPDGKPGDEISLGGQIVGLAEAWTALLEQRAHRDRMSRADAMATLAAATGRWFAEPLVQALRRADRS